MSLTKIKIIVGMSGGVDSSVAAFLLQKQGFEVEGLFMKNWEEDDNERYCPASIDYADAQAVCDKLNIPLHAVNFSKEYWDNVFMYFLKEYELGRTPNPDILCNREIKFKAFLNYAKNMGAHAIATGHYARTQHGTLLKGCDNHKDQSYFLYTLTQKELNQTLFPIGELPKTKVRQLAQELGLITHDKKDSTGICFIGERRFKNFLSQYLPAKAGVIEAEDGEILGTHEGLMYYTIGQRKGIGIGGLHHKIEEPWYVAKKDLSRNVLIVVQGHHHPLLLKTQLNFTQAHWVNGAPPAQSFHCKAKTRYRQQDQSCFVEQQDHDTWLATFEQPQRAITPGQSIVLYHDDLCLGGGVIDA